MYSSTLSLTSALDGVGGLHHGPAALPPGKTRYPLHRRLGGPQGRSGRVLKISPPHRDSIPGPPRRSESLYRLIYPAQQPGRPVRYAIYLLPHACQTAGPRFNQFDLIWSRKDLQIMKPLIVQSCSACRHLVLLSCRYLTPHPIFRHPYALLFSQCASPNSIALKENS